MKRTISNSLKSLGHAAQVPAREDPLSETLEHLSLRCWLAGPFELSAPWGLRVANGMGWFYLIRSGACVVETDGNGEPIHAKTGDLIILAQGQGHRLRDCPDTPATAIEQLLNRDHFERQTRLIHGGHGAPTTMSCGCFVFDDLEQSPLHHALPPLIRIAGKWGKPQPYVDYILLLAAQEALSADPCAPAINNRLVRILLTKALHSYVRTSPPSVGGWLSAIKDPDIGQAIRIMHASPEENWTVASLAEAVAMSRSVFSGRFTTMVGKPPLEYLSELRMRKACLLLRTTRAELKEVAMRVGYESAAAFSKAFSRRMGTSPGNFRRLSANLAHGYTAGIPPICPPHLAHKQAETVACTASARKTL